MQKKVPIILLIVALLLSALAFAVSRWHVRGIDKVIQGSESIVLDLWLDEIPAVRPELLRVGDKSNLIVRNRPHGALEIIAVRCGELPIERYYLKKYGTLISDKRIALEPKLIQCRVELRDNQALKTANGYLSHGNQLKISNRITLEGQLYNINGYLVDIRAAADAPQK